MAKYPIPKSIRHRAYLVATYDLWQPTKTELRTTTFNLDDALIAAAKAISDHGKWIPVHYVSAAEYRASMEATDGQVQRHETPGDSQAASD